MYFGGMARRFAKVGRLVAVLLTAICFCACVEDDVNRGNEALRIGDYDRAVANFSKALDMQPANRDARYGLALAYYSIAEENERLKVPVLETWQRTVNEFRIPAGAFPERIPRACSTWRARRLQATGMPMCSRYSTSLSPSIARTTSVTT